MKTYQGAAFYIDILGFSALTQGLVIGLEKSDYEAWGLNDERQQNHHVLAATIIVEFRNVLKALKEHIVVRDESYYTAQTRCRGYCRQGLLRNFY